MKTQQLSEILSTIVQEVLASMARLWPVTAWALTLDSIIQVTLLFESGKARVIHSALVLVVTAGFAVRKWSARETKVASIGCPKYGLVCSGFWGKSLYYTLCCAESTRGVHYLKTDWSLGNTDSVCKCGFIMGA